MLIKYCFRSAVTVETVTVVLTNPKAGSEMVGRCSCVLSDGY